MSPADAARLHCPVINRLCFSFHCFSWVPINERSGPGYCDNPNVRRKRTSDTPKKMLELMKKQIELYTENYILPLTVPDDAPPPTPPMELTRPKPKRRPKKKAAKKK